MITNIAVDKKYPLGHYFAILSKAYVGSMFNSLQGNAADRYYMVLQVLDQPKLQFTQQSLGNFLNVDKVTMVRIIDHLTERGIIERINNPVDRREKFIKLTALGKKSLKQVNRVMLEMNEITMSGFSAKEKDLLFSMIERMNQNLCDLPTETIYLNFKRIKK